MWLARASECGGMDADGRYAYGRDKVQKDKECQGVPYVPVEGK